MGAKPDTTVEVELDLARFWISVALYTQVVCKVDAFVHQGATLVDELLSYPTTILISFKVAELEAQIVEQENFLQSGDVPDRSF